MLGPLKLLASPHRTVVGGGTPLPLAFQSLHPLRTHRWRGLLASKASSATSVYMKLVPRWRRNLSRLYARRILELAAASAAASAASYRLRTQLDAAGGAVVPPSAWRDWQQPDWEETAMASVGKTSLGRFWMATKRLVGLSLLASPFLALGPLSYVSTSAQTASWDYALWAIEKAGPTYIKLMQWASTRQDLFSPEFCAHFGKLRDNTRGHSFRETRKILREELGEKGLEALEISNTPIGSGCIAQVRQICVTLVRYSTVREVDSSHYDDIAGVRRAAGKTVRKLSRGDKGRHQSTASQYLEQSVC